MYAKKFFLEKTHILEHYFRVKLACYKIILEKMYVRILS